MTQGWGAPGEQDLAARIDALEARVAQLESVVAGAQSSTAGTAVTQEPVDPWSQPPWPEIVDLVRRGRKIEAIKVHRGFFRTGLKESKDVIDQLG
jgi:ribosomal protein L7/L12